MEDTMLIDIRWKFPYYYYYFLLVANRACNDFKIMSRKDWMLEQDFMADESIAGWNNNNNKY